VLGFLNTGSKQAYARLLQAFKAGLKETGFVEGENFTFEYRWVNNERDKLQPMAEELVARKVNLIAATGGSPAALAAKAATSTIPIVFAIGIDPVRVGLVSSLAHPGANLTGTTMLAANLGSKRVQLLLNVVPNAKVVAALVNPNSPGTQTIPRGLRTANRALGRKINVIHAASKADFEPAFATLSRLHVDALIIGADLLFNNDGEQLGTLCIHHRVPAIFQFREFTSAGGLMSYGGDIEETYRQAGVYAGRILKGEKPADLPVQQVTKIKLIINLKTAKALGIDVPPTLLATADEVIE
jgi:putative ABC transport system substrate-binding protein